MSRYRLMGKTVTGFEINSERDQITFQTTDGPVRMVTEGDCCSQTWIESLDAPEALLGTVRSVEDVEMPQLGNVPTPHRTSVEEVAYYGLKVTTEKGTCVLDYRNDGNGYYGGSIADAGF